MKAIVRDGKPMLVADETFSRWDGERWLMHALAHRLKSDSINRRIWIAREITFGETNYVIRQSRMAKLIIDNELENQIAGGTKQERPHSFAEVFKYYTGFNPREFLIYNPDKENSNAQATEDPVHAGPSEHASRNARRRRGARVRHPDHAADQP